MRSESIRILKELFDIDLVSENIQHIAVSSDLTDSSVSSTSLDSITYDLIVSPVAIPIGTDVDEVVLVNQRTMHTILLEGVNPFTRQSLTYAEVIEINQRPDVMEKLHCAMNTIRGLRT